MAAAFLHRIKAYPLQNLPYDVLAGLVVFLVAIPLCLGIALASGAPLFSGIISGILGGLVVGALSQSAVSVSGPAAGLVAVVLASIAELGGFNHFLFALMLAGLLQILIGALRAGFIADYIPSNVIGGLLCAIGVLIIIKQLPLAFTHASSYSALMTSLRDTSQDYQWQPVLHLLSHVNVGATVISLLSLATLVFFDKQQRGWLANVPGAVVVVFLGVAINELYDWVLPNLTQDSTRLVNLPVSHSFQQFLSHFARPDFSHWRHLDIYVNALILAVVASLETLLNLEGSIKLDKRRRPCSADRELIAQGVGNTLAGFIGGLPITSVVIRTSVNVNAGARSKLATLAHGLFILIAVMLAPHWLNCIPLASLAAILIYSGYKLSHPVIFKRMFAKGWSYFIPFIVTLLMITFTTLLIGILVGLAVSFFFILKRNSEARLDIFNEKHPSGVIKRILLPEQITFLSKASLAAELHDIAADTTLVIDASHTQYMDQDILELLDDFKDRQAPDKNIQLSFTGFKEKYDIHNQIEFINVTTFDIQSALSPKEALAILKEGNQRFIKNTPINRNLPEEIKATSRSQFPIAVVLSCIDSRMPIESVFDVGVGDVFVARVAGNVINDDILASIEFACHTAGVKLIVVLGHTRCSAISAACQAKPASSEHLAELFNKIKPAIEAEHETKLERHHENEAFMLNVTRQNVTNTVHAIFAESQLLRDAINQLQVGLVGALYDVRTGKVQFDPDFYPGH